MRVMIFAKSTPEAELAPRGAEGYEEMARFHEELSNAGVLLDSGALLPSTEGARVRFEGEAATVTDGPFTESKELVAGYWLWQVRSIDEAVEWLKRAPFGDGMELEIRPLFDMDMSAAEAPAKD
jgi:hypothetical protein